MVNDVVDDMTIDWRVNKVYVGGFVEIIIWEEHYRTKKANNAHKRVLNQANKSKKLKWMSTKKYDMAWEYCICVVDYPQE